MQDISLIDGVVVARQIARQNMGIVNGWTDFNPTMLQQFAGWVDKLRVQVGENRVGLVTMRARHDGPGWYTLVFQGWIDKDTSYLFTVYRVQGITSFLENKDILEEQVTTLNGLISAFTDWVNRHGGFQRAISRPPGGGAGGVGTELVYQSMCMLHAHIVALEEKCIKRCTLE